MFLGGGGPGSTLTAGTAPVRPPLRCLTVYFGTCKFFPVRVKIPIIRTGRVAGVLLRGTLVALLLAVAACETGPPVQEMSDARQAIAVAREAGAEDRAADELREAEAYLDSAEKRLAERAYAEAREDAKQAKVKALDALAAAENQEQD